MCSYIKEAKRIADQARKPRKPKGKGGNPYGWIPGTSIFVPEEDPL